MHPIARGLFEGFRYTHQSFELAVDDLDRGQLLHRTRGGSGPSILWHLGHLMHYRIIVLNRLGEPRESPYAASFGSEGATGGAEYPEIDALRSQWNALHAEVERAFENVSDAQLDATYRLADGRESERTLLQALGFFGWHEAMHMGGITVIRVELGVPSLAERAFGGRRR